MPRYFTDECSDLLSLEKIPLILHFAIQGDDKKDNNDRSTNENNKYKISIYKRHRAVDYMPMNKFYKPISRFIV